MSSDEPDTYFTPTLKNCMGTLAPLVNPVGAVMSTEEDISLRTSNLYVVTYQPPGSPAIIIATSYLKMYSNTEQNHCPVRPECKINKINNPLDIT